ncbi:MAG: hypothetical protein ACQEWV_19555 [Bacillota bacterium]
MKYSTVNQIIESSDSIQALTYLKDLWYAMEEGFFALSLDYEGFKRQFMHLRANAPLNWRLDWDGSQFSLSKEIVNHSVISIIAQSNGQIIYKFS